MSSTTMQQAAPGDGHPPPERLKAERVQLRLAEIPGWELEPGGGSLRRTFGFRTGAPAAQLVGLIGALAEEAGHRPSRVVMHHTVVCELATPGAQGVTEQDLDLARRISLVG